MRLTLLAAAAVTALAGAACAQTAAAPQAAAPATTPAPAPAPKAFAVAALKTATGAEAGTVSAFQGPAGVLFKVDGEGWPEGWHGVHLHAVGTCDGPAFTSAGAHVNHASPSPHGLLNANGGPDLGDLQNVYAGADGKTHAEVYLAGTEVNLMDADGVSFLVHANRDDHVSQPIGGAGARIACGVFAKPAVTGQ